MLRHAYPGRCEHTAQQHQFRNRQFAAVTLARKLAASGVILQSVADKIARCGRSRFRCCHMLCPRCYSIELAHTAEQIWWGVVSPELARRQRRDAATDPAIGRVVEPQPWKWPNRPRVGRKIKPTGRSRPYRLVVGTVAVECAVDELPATLDKTRREHWTQIVCRLAHLRDGMVCTPVPTPIANESGRVRVTLSVLGLSDRPVHVANPQPRDGRFTVTWHSPVRGHAAPMFGAKVLLDLLYDASPYPAALLHTDVDAVGGIVRTMRNRKRVQSLGAWRGVVGGNRSSNNGRDWRQTFGSACFSSPPRRVRNLPPVPIAAGATTLPAGRPPLRVVSKPKYAERLSYNDAADVLNSHRRAACEQRLQKTVFRGYEFLRPLYGQAKQIAFDREVCDKLLAGLGVPVKERFNLREQAAAELDSSITASWLSTTLGVPVVVVARHDYMLSTRGYLPDPDWLEMNGLTAESRASPWYDRLWREPTNLRKLDVPVEKCRLISAPDGPTDMLVIGGVPVPPGKPPRFAVVFAAGWSTRELRDDMAWPLDCGRSRLVAVHNWTAGWDAFGDHREHNAVVIRDAETWRAELVLQPLNGLIDLLKGWAWARVHAGRPGDSRLLGDALQGQQASEHAMYRNALRHMAV